MIANVTREARQKLNRDLPPDATPEQEDAMRRRVEELVDDVCLFLSTGSGNGTNSQPNSISEPLSLLLRAASRSTVWTLKSWNQNWRKPRRAKVRTFSHTVAKPFRLTQRDRDRAVRHEASTTHTSISSTSRGSHVTARESTTNSTDSNVPEFPEIIYTILRKS